MSSGTAQRASGTPRESSTPGARAAPRGAEAGSEQSTCPQVVFKCLFKFAIPECCENKTQRDPASLDKLGTWALILHRERSWATLPCFSSLQLNPPKILAGVRNTALHGDALPKDAQEAAIHKVRMPLLLRRRANIRATIACPSRSFAIIADGNTRILYFQ